MFKPSPLAGVVAHLRNGSVPSIGGSMTLQAALARVEAAEAQLEAARVQAKAVARREGRPIASLFGEGKFVLRATAEKWTDAAREQGLKAGCDAIVRSLTLDESPPF
jgi:hypothetical protein